MKVTLDYGEVAFLLYKGECRRFRIGSGEGGRTELSDEDYALIRDEVLLPRAKKRVLYYMKNADKTRARIRRKLAEGLYPEEVITAVMAFLDQYGFADDRRYAADYLAELKGTRSRREIEAKLMQRGIPADGIRLQLETLTEEDEDRACAAALTKKYPRGVPREERQKAYAHLARKGYSPDTIRRALGAAAEPEE